MFADSLAPGARRKGIVLVLILGMLGLLALIGVTFASFAGQSLINSRNFALSEKRPNPEQYMDFALAQLINDTNNPLSALRGHSLLRDMYGNDSVFRQTTAAEIRGYLDRVEDNTGSVGHLAPLTVTSVGAHPNPGLNQSLAGYVQIQTNIPTANFSYTYYGLNFTRWILRMGNTFDNNNNLLTVAQTFEVLEDDDTGQYHLLTLSPPEAVSNSNLKAPQASQPHNTSAPPVTDTRIYSNPLKPNAPLTTGNDKFLISMTQPTSPGATFILDGRYMRAFNGPGLSRSLMPFANLAGPVSSGGMPLVPFNVAAYANFRVNGSLTNPNYPFVTVANGQPTSNFPTVATFGDPDLIGMDEDYDACDLENWFLAIQSADGQVIVPSFHRPGILTAQDWQYPATNLGSNTAAAQAALAGIAKILRPRQIDNSPLFPADPIPSPTTGQINYDVDNDGDGVTDSVWLDLGYPTQQDVGGKLFKPLFAFMVIGENGRLPLNTVGNLQARDFQTPTTDTTKYQTAGATAYGPDANANTQYGQPLTYFDAPLWDHASHLGHSVNEINPKYALQNAPANVYSVNVSTAANNNLAQQSNPQNPNNYPPSVTDLSYSQIDNAGIDVALTQLRNLLAGTIPQDNPHSPINPYSERNWVFVAGKPYFMPNGLIDGQDGAPSSNGGGLVSALSNTPPFVNRAGVPAVPGRWGEPEGIPRQLYLDSNGNGPTTIYPTGVIPPLPQTVSYGAANSATYSDLVPNGNVVPVFQAYTNPVRAGRSYFNPFGLAPSNFNAATQTYGGDPFDDDNDSFMPAYGGVTYPEQTGYYDAAGQVAISSERIRRFLTPIDLAGVGRAVDWMSRPKDALDYGNGFDKFGRVSHFRYFRPPGVPMDIVPYANIQSAMGTTSQFYHDAYRMTVYGGPTIPAVPTGTMSAGNVPYGQTVSNNLYHGYESFRNPISKVPLTSAEGGMQGMFQVATMAAMPYNAFTGANGYQLVNATTAYLESPTLVSSSTFNGNINSQSGPFYLGFNPPLTASYPNAIPQYNEMNNNATYPSTLGTSPFFPQDPYGVNGSNSVPIFATVVNGYPGGSLSKDEADEMNLYTPNRHDMPFGPTDLEWLYRLQDVDGASLTSRLGQLAPISFLNPADGQTRRRLFSIDSWEPNSFILANDNPQGQFPYNSRFTPFANASLANINVISNIDPYISSYGTQNNVAGYTQAGANPLTAEGLPNPTLAAPIENGVVPKAMSGTDNYNYATYVNVNNGYNAQIPLPANMTTNTSNGIPAPIATPGLAHRDRRINLNYPLPVASDPAEPVRQKWIRDTYQLLKATLPPQSVDTPEELAALSQFVVNIIDFRDPDATMTRFVNTDLMVVSAVPASAGVNGRHSGVKFATIPVPNVSDYPSWDPANANNANLNPHSFYPFDPMIALEQTFPGANWTSAMTTDSVTGKPDAFLVQYGMEYNPIAINEVLAYSYNGKLQGTAGQPNSFGANGVSGSPVQVPRFYIELINTLNEDSSHDLPVTSGASVVGSQDMNLAGWDMLITPDNDPRGRPDPITGNLPYDIGGIAYSSPTVPGYVPALITAPGTTNTTIIPPSPTGTQYPAGTIGWGIPLTGLPDCFSGNQYSVANQVNGVVQVPVYIPAMGSTGPSQSGGSPMPDAAGSPTSLYRVTNSYFVMAAPMPGTNVPFMTQAPNNNSTTTPSFSTNSGGTLYDTNPATLSPDYILPNGFAPPNPVGTPATAADNGPGAPYPPTPADPGPGVPYPPDPQGFMANPPRQSGPSPTPGTGSGYYWLHLRRPANPFNPGSEMVVVDSMRFPYAIESASGKTVVTGNNANGPIYSDQVSGSVTFKEIFSARRLQPYRGGHAVASLMNVTDPSPATAYGYAEQTQPVLQQLKVGGSNYSYGTYGGNPNIYTTGFVFHSINASNSTEAWDHLVFHDRDFASPGELLLVPGCPPGLFTKQFVEQPFNDLLAPTTKYGTYTNFGGSYIAGTSFPTQRPNFTGTPATPGGAGTVPSTGTSSTAPPFSGDYGSDFPANHPPSHPYLPDKFYYTAVSVLPSADPNDVNKAGPYPAQLGGWTGTGWFKMFDLFEVPSTAYGAFATTDQGENFDWYRADRKPGLINLNLILDEEIFFGILDDPRLDITLAANGYFSTDVTSSYFTGGVANPYTVFADATNSATIPQIVSQVDEFGFPTAYYPISSLASTTAYAPGGGGPGGINTFVNTTSNTPITYTNPDPSNAGSFLLPNGNVNPFPTPEQVGRGFTYPDPTQAGNQGAIVVTGTPISTINANLPNSNGLQGIVPYPPTLPNTALPQTTIHGMKAAFADFLKLRHGGSNFLFGHGQGIVGGPYSVDTTTTPPTVRSNTGVVGNTFLTGMHNAPFLSEFPALSLPADQPYRSLSYPDINYTVMRPATQVPPPQVIPGVGVLGTSFQYLNAVASSTVVPPYQYFAPTTGPGGTTVTIGTAFAQNVGNTTGFNLPSQAGNVASGYIGDPGVRFPFMDLNFPNATYYNTPVAVLPPVPPIPPRRLFQIPDFNAAGSNDSNASRTGDPQLNTFFRNHYLSDPEAEITWNALTGQNNPPTYPQPPANNPTAVTAPTSSFLAPTSLGTAGNYKQLTTQDGLYLGYNSSNEYRAHPAYRTEWLQKVMNLTTVRTHQFAVWITVGFFEVTHAGVPELGIADVLGQELNLAGGKNERYRSFFVLDRTRAAGFNPYYPGDFRDVVTYRRRIE